MQSGYAAHIIFGLHLHRFLGRIITMQYLELKELLEYRSHGIHVVLRGDHPLKQLPCLGEAAVFDLFVHIQVPEVGALRIAT